MTDTQIQTELEKLVDSSSLTAIANFLSEICYEKANHIRENWQDNQLAKTWEKDGYKFADLTEKLNN